MDDFKHVRITLVYTLGHCADEHRFTTTVRLAPTDPYTEVWDAAADRLIDTHPHAEILHEE
jgi:hypothetical protein